MVRGDVRHSETSPHSGFTLLQGQSTTRVDERVSVTPVDEDIHAQGCFIVRRSQITCSGRACLFLSHMRIYETHVHLLTSLMIVSALASTSFTLTRSTIVRIRSSKKRRKKFLSDFRRQKLFFKGWVFSVLSVCPSYPCDKAQSVGTMRPVLCTNILILLIVKVEI